MGRKAAPQDVVPRDDGAQGALKHVSLQMTFKPNRHGHMGRKSRPVQLLQKPQTLLRIGKVMRIVFRVALDDLKRGGVRDSPRIRHALGKGGKGRCVK